MWRPGPRRLILGFLLLGGAVWIAEAWPAAARARSIFRSLGTPAHGPGGTRAPLWEELGLPAWTRALPMSPADLPSSRVLGEADLRDDEWTLSLVAADADLHDDRRGIIANRTGRGRAWERVSYVSFYEGRELRAASRVGLRIHGHISRTDGRRPSFKLRFRSEYGAAEVPEALPFSFSTDRLVLRFEPNLPFVNSIALSIGERIGAVVPERFPVRFFLNGRDRGWYLLSEQVSAKGWGESRLAADDSRFFQYRATNSEADTAAFNEFVSWVDALPRPLDLARLESRVDVDLFTRHLLTFMFCGTGDWAQGGFVIPGEGQPAYWVLWDLDLSFRSRLEEPWRRMSVGYITNPPRAFVERALRRRLFMRLLDESPEYRRRFVDTVTEVLNHRLTREALIELYRDHRRLARGSEDPFRNFDLQSFLLHRHRKLLADVRTLLELEPPVEITIVAPADGGLIVDGHAIADRYRGTYFPGQLVTVEVAPDLADRLRHWRVGSSRATETTLRVPVTEALTIRPVMRR